MNACKFEQTERPVVKKPVFIQIKMHFLKPAVICVLNCVLILSIFRPSFVWILWFVLILLIRHPFPVLGPNLVIHKTLRKGSLFMFLPVFLENLVHRASSPFPNRPNGTIRSSTSDLPRACTQARKTLNRLCLKGSRSHSNLVFFENLLNLSWCFYPAFQWFFHSSDSDDQKICWMKKSEKNKFDKNFIDQILTKFFITGASKYQESKWIDGKSHS